MSDEWDDATRRILQSGKEESDLRSKHGLPLDGNYDRAIRADDLRGSASGSEAAGCVAGLLKVALIVTVYLIAGAFIAALAIGGFMLKLIFNAIFSRRR